MTHLVRWWYTWWFTREFHTDLKLREGHVWNCCWKWIWVNYITLWWTNSLLWKITIFNFGKLFLWVMASMSQTVTTYQRAIQQPEKVRYIGTNHHYSDHVLLSPWANHQLWSLKLAIWQKTRPGPKVKAGTGTHPTSLLITYTTGVPSGNLLQFAT